jgi:CRISPR/Cas system CSM-associated protein Csm3 (group 7 of RAMP superfamily)
MTNTTMSTTIDYTIELLSDAEPGTGIGSEYINDRVPRDRHGHPILPGSHLKGLVRDAGDRLCQARAWGDDLFFETFGREGDTLDGGVSGLASFSTARLQSPEGSASTVRFISEVTRTKIGEHGTVAIGSLRTVERVHVGSEFHGRVFVAGHPTSHHVDFVKLALMSLSAVGGNRTRGSGRVKVSIAGEKRRPSQILRELHEAIQSPRPAPAAAVRQATTLGTETTLLELTFVAHDPVCCPRTPIGETNSIRSGFEIPASAVQGAVLHRLDRIDTALATACFESGAFRAWPMLPVARDSQDPQDPQDDHGLPVRISLSHRMSKSLAGEVTEHDFKDTVIAPYHWSDVPSGAPLKGCDGVLIDRGGTVELWRDADMPRQISAHVNLSKGQGDPDLYTVEAMAPIVWRGVMALPEAAAEVLCKSLEADAFCRFGKARTVRGGGKLTAKRCSASGDATTLDALMARERSVFVVQSPLMIPDDWAIGEAGAVLDRLVAEAGWGEVKERAASIETLFGWNSHGKGRGVEGSRRLRAVRVVAPGSVFKLTDPLAAGSLRTKLLAGIGGGREQGLGSVLPHPGIAGARYGTVSAEPQRLESADNAGKIAQQLIEASSGSGLSASAISRTVSFAAMGRASLRSFLETQKNERPESSWRRWKPTFKQLMELIDNKQVNDQTLARALKAWRDAAVGDRKDGGR